MTELLKTLQQYPKTWKKFEKWFTAQSYGYWINKSGALCANTNGEPPTTYKLIGLLTDFCDGEGYYVYVYPIKGQDGHYWHYAINFEDGSRFFSAEKLKLEDEIKPFDSRQEAFEQGIIKAFSLMENK